MEFILVNLFHWQKVLFLQPARRSASCNEIRRLLSRIVMIFTSFRCARNSWNSFALRWSIFSSEVERCVVLLWSCFEVRFIY